MIATARLQRMGSRFLSELLILVISVLFALPIYHALRRSVSPPLGLGNYVVVFNDARLWNFLANSTVISVGTIVLTVSCASLAAFAFSKLQFPLRDVIFYLLLTTLLIPAATLIVPLFVLIRSLGLYNSHLGIILVQVAFGVPFHTVLIRNYFDRLPREMIDAARIDGCTNLQALAYILMPLSLPIQAVVVTLTFLGSWNNYLMPLLLLKDEAKYTVPMAAVTWANQAGNLAQFGQVAYDTLFAGLFFLAAPTVIIFLLLQRVFIGSITQGALRA